MFFAMDAILKKYLCNLYFSERQLQEIKSLYPLCNEVFRGRLPLVARTLYLRRAGALFSPVGRLPVEILASTWLSLIRAKNYVVCL